MNEKNGHFPQWAAAAPPGTAAQGGNPAGKGGTGGAAPLPQVIFAFNIFDLDNNLAFMILYLFYFMQIITCQ